MVQHIHVRNNVFKEYEYIDISSLPDLGGKFVIVGVTAEGITNQPIQRGNMYPQHIHAHMLQNFIDGFKHTAEPPSPFIELHCVRCVA